MLPSVLLPVLTHDLGLSPMETFSTSFAPFLAAATQQDFVNKLKEVLTMIMAVAFLYGAIRIIGGAMQMRRGETEEGKQSLMAGALIAAAPMIMRILYGIFFDGSVGL